MKDYPIHFSDQLSQHLKSFRRLRGLTQTQLATQLGVTQSRVADIERNPSTVSLENLLKVFAALDILLVLRDSGKESPSGSMKNTPETLAEIKSEGGWSSRVEDDW